MHFVGGDNSVSNNLGKGLSFGTVPTRQGQSEQRAEQLVKIM